MNRIVVVTAVAIAVFLGAGASSQAEIVAISSTGGGSDPEVGSLTIGFEFTPQVQIQVTEVGVFDVGGNGFGVTGTDTHQVGIWRVSDSLQIVVDTVTSSDLLDGGYRFSALASPQTLQAGTAYVIGAFYTSTADRLFNSTLTADPLISIPGVNTTGSATRFSFGTSLSVPTTENNFQRTNVNFKAVAVPEPGSVALCAIAALGLVWQHRRLSRSSA